MQGALQAPDPRIETLYEHVYSPESRDEFRRMCVGAPFEEAEAFLACQPEPAR